LHQLAALTRMRTVDGQIFHYSEFGKIWRELGDVFQTVNGLCFLGGLRQSLPVARNDPLRVSDLKRWVKLHLLFWQRAQFTLV